MSGFAARISSAFADHESWMIAVVARSSCGQTSTQYFVQATKTSSRPRSASVTVTLGCKDAIRNDPPHRILECDAAIRQLRECVPQFAIRDLMTRCTRRPYLTTSKTRATRAKSRNPPLASGWKTQFAGTFSNSLLLSRMASWLRSGFAQRDAFRPWHALRPFAN